MDKTLALQPLNIFSMGNSMRVPEGYADRNICIVGLGYVGLTLAVAMCDVGFHVHGIERDSRILTALGEGHAHFFENGLNERIEKHTASGAFTFAPKFDETDDNSVYIITVGTPLTPQKHTNLIAIKNVAEDLSKVLNLGDMVLLRSTVRVGVTRDVVKPVLDATGIGYDLAFCPERTLEGKAIDELRSLPQIVGGIDVNSALRAKQIFGFLTPTTIMVSSLETAEMVKLINNTQRDFMFSFANEVAEMCDTVGVSAAEVINAGARGYPRAIGVMPGPVGGPCLEKDPYILTEGVVQGGGQPGLILDARRFNEQLPGRSVALIGRYFLGHGVQPKKIVVFGLAFKGRPETSDLRGSLAYPLVDELRSRFYTADIGGYDPSVDMEEAKSFNITLYQDVESAAKDADLILFQTNNPLFEKIDLLRLSEQMNDFGIVYDYWNQFSNITVAPRRSYAGLGSWLHAKVAKG